MSMPYEHLKSIDVQPMLIPVPGMEPASATIKFRASEMGPSPLQLELVERILPEFPRLWNEALQGLQADYGESIPILYDPVETFGGVAVMIPPWEDRRDDAETSTPIEPSVENYYWSMYFAHHAIPDCIGCESEFEGLRFVSTMLYW